MNFWTERSINLANNSNYLDELFKVYPISKNFPRNMSSEDIDKISSFFEKDVSTIDEDNQIFLETLINMVKKSSGKREKSDALLFPLKDSYVPYLKQDPSAIRRNPRTTNRLIGEIRELGMDGIITNMTLPKESNRQMGPSFNNWLNKNNAMGAKLVSDEEEFLNSREDMVF